MKSRATAFTVLLSTIVLTASGCFKQISPMQDHKLNQLNREVDEWIKQTEAQSSEVPPVVATTGAQQGQTVAGLSIQSPLSFVRANQRFDVGLRELPAEIRSKILSYESWDAVNDEGTWKIVVNRITYHKGTELDLDAAAEGSVEDIAIGLENACKPQYVIHSRLVANLPGRYLSLSCNLPQEGPVYVEGMTFADRETLWQVQVAFEDKAKLAAAKNILASIKMAQLRPDHKPNQKVEGQIGKEFI